MRTWKKSQCNMCGLACGLEMEIENNEIVNVRPDPDNPRTKRYCCRKGRAAKYYQTNTDRLNYPQKRVGNKFIRITWDQAFQEIAEKASAIIREYGPRSFALCGCALASAHSDAAVAKPLMAALGSQYYYGPIGIEFAGNWWSHGKILGDQNYFTEPDEEKNEVLLFWGSNSYVSHQISEARRTIRKFSEDPNRMVIDVDPRMSETARMSDMHIAPQPGSDALLLRAMISIILKRGWQHQDFLDLWAADYDKIIPWFDGFDIIGALQVCGTPYVQIEEFCRILSTRKWGLHQDLGIFCGRHSTLNSYLLVILQAVTGMLCVSGGNIVQDAFKHRGPTTHEEDPAVWRTVKTNRFPVLGTYPAGCLSQEILSDHPQRLRILMTSRTNPIRSFPDSKAMKKASEKLDLLVVIDVCETETTRLADYILPGKTGYESYEFSMFQATYPHVTCQLKHPVLEQTAERKEDAEIWLGIAKAMGVIPPMPEYLYQAAEKSVAENDRITFMLTLSKYIEEHQELAPVMSLIIAEVMGKAMGSAARAMIWAALLTSHLGTTGIIERAGFSMGDKHKQLQGHPKLSPMILMDNVFQAVDDHPEGVVIGISYRETCLPDHIFHEDKKLHLYCDEINNYIQRITPEAEAIVIKGEAEFPMVLSAGRHSDGGHNATMRNPATYQYRQPYTVAINPEDATELNLENSQNVRVVTKTGSVVAPVEYTWQTSRGYALIPHHFGFQFDGKEYGSGINEVTAAKDMDELTGNPTLRFVPCRIEAVERS